MVTFRHPVSPAGNAPNESVAVTPPVVGSVTVCVEASGATHVVLVAAVSAPFAVGVGDGVGEAT